MPVSKVFAVPDEVRISRDDTVPAAYEEICRNGIESDKSVTITLRPIMARGGRGQANLCELPAGRYRIELLMLDPHSTGLGRRLFDVSVNGETDRIDIFKQTGRANRILVCAYTVALERPGRLNVTLEPVKGKVLLCGAVLRPGR
jgi:hypothetical protein